MTACPGCLHPSSCAHHGCHGQAAPESDDEQQARALRKWAAGEMEAKRPEPTDDADVERMARHLCDVLPPGEPRMVPYWRHLTEDDRRHYRDVARAAMALGARMPEE